MRRARIFLRIFLMTGALVITAPATSPLWSQPGRGTGGMMGPGMGMGMGRDSSTMAVMGTVHELLMQHEKLRRTVTNLPNGIRTLTESDDSTMAAQIKAHVALTGPFVTEAKDFVHPMASPALHALLKNGARITRRSEVTARGVLLEETSDDPQVVALLQTHAAEVSALVEGGMAAMRESMMRRRR
jgi:hypothetical protein